MMRFERLSDTFRGEIDRARWTYAEVFVNPFFVVEIRGSEYTSHATVEMNGGDTWITRGTPRELRSVWCETVRDLKGGTE